MVTRAAPHNPVPVEALPEFTPVPRKRPRHDGWTPERQRAFVEALADTGCVSIACRMVNMSQRSYYHLRRQPGAQSFRAAADAAHTLGLQVVKDEAFDRAMHGQLVPVFVGGKLMGFRRKKNDRLLMFILRHYGTDAAGRRTTINYFSTRATAGAGTASPSPARGRGQGEGLPESLAAAESSTTTVKTVISGNAAPAGLAADTEAAAVLNAFEGVALDAEAHEEIARALEACAERRRMLDPDYDTPRPERLRLHAQDEQCDFIRSPPGAIEFVGELERDGGCEEFVPFAEGEPPWEQIGAPVPEWFQQWIRDQGAECEAIGEQGEERPLLGQPAPEATGLTSRSMVRDGLPAGSATAHPEQGPSEVEGRVEERKPKRAYRPRTPKPPFAPPDAAAEARAREEVAVERREAAEAEGVRRRKRKISPAESEALASGNRGTYHEPPTCGGE